jgi:catalase
MSSIAKAVASGISSITDDPKRADLKRDIVDVTSESGLTTDHGVKVSDTDTWCVHLPLAMTLLLSGHSSTG